MANGEPSPSLRLCEEGPHEESGPQKLPLRQAQGALAKLWSDYTYFRMSNRMASKIINRENARRMIDTSGMLRKERFDAYQSGRLSVYMEEVVRRLERLQKLSLIHI